MRGGENQKFLRARVHGHGEILSNKMGTWVKRGRGTGGSGCGGEVNKDKTRGNQKDQKSLETSELKK